jgi:hypothetical protein
MVSQPHATAPDAMTFLSRLLGRAGAAEPAALSRFLGRQAAYVAQKTVVDYCRVKAGRHESQLFADPDFLAALRHCRWQVFFAAVADVSALAEGWLRPHARGREAALGTALVALGRGVLEAEAVPDEERAARDAACEALAARLAALLAAPPVPADRMPLAAEAPLFATLPVHPEQRRGESEAIRGALRFHVVTTQEELERGFDAPRLAARLLVP